MKHVIPHQLDPDLARRAADQAFASYKARFDDYAPEARWVDDRHADISFRAKGLTLTGGLDVEPDRFVLELKVPLLLRPFQKRAVGVIDEEVRRWIAKAERGELQ